MPTITCSLCRKSFESGPEHCPHCYMRVPGTVTRKPVVQRGSPSKSNPRLASRGAAPRRTSGTRVPEASLQCPACMHTISRDDEWCRWCKWPVNRGST